MNTLCVLAIGQYYINVFCEFVIATCVLTFTVIHASLYD